MSAALDEYEAEYRSHVQAAEEKLAVADHSGPHSDSGRSALNAAERAAEAAKDVVQLMELEGRSLSGSARSKLQTSLRSCRNEVAAIRERLKGLRQAARTPPPRSSASDRDRIREECFAGSGGYGSDSAAERSRMLANNERLGKAGERLQQAHQVTLDMENTANSILGDLSRQRETLLHAKGTLKYAADGLDASKRILSQMARRAAMNKITMWLVVALLVGMILLLMMSGGGGAGGNGSGSSGAIVQAGATVGWEKATKG
jgi:vesicle transport through interaction with t-SNAREs 1